VCVRLGETDVSLCGKTKLGGKGDGNLYKAFRIENREGSCGGG